MPTTATSRKSNSWRTSASRRSRQPNTTTSGIDNSTYKLNPYKNNRVTTTINNKGKVGGGKLRNSGGNSNNPQVRGVIIDDDDDELNNDYNNNSNDSKKEDTNILNDILNSDEDDDDLGLDNILSSISDNKSISNTSGGVTIQSLANVKQQQDNDKEADSNNILLTTNDYILPSSVQQPTIATNNNINNNNIRLPSNNSRHDINRLSDTTPPIQNASSNIGSGANKIEGSSSPPQDQQHQQQQIVSNISSRALDFDIENDILPSASHNITQESSALFPTPVRNAKSSELDGSDKRVPSSENIIPPGKCLLVDLYLG